MIFPKGCIHFSVFGIDVPIVKINGHICISICEFPAPCEVWSFLSSALDQGDPDLELVRLPAFPTATCVNGREPSASFVVAGMAHCGEAPGHRGDDADPLHDEHCAAGAATSVVDCSPGPSAPAAHERPPRGHCKPCKHPPASIARSGIQRGSFSRCLACGTRWRYVLGAWEELPYSQQLPLPQPSDTSSVRPKWATQLVPEAPSSSTTSRKTSLRNRLVPGAKAAPEDKVIPKPPRQGIDPDRPLALTAKERASLVLGAPSEQAPLKLDPREVAKMQTEAEELDKMMAELAARKAELAKASATAKAAPPAAPSVPTIPTDTDEEAEPDYDWAVVLDV